MSAVNFIEMLDGFVAKFRKALTRRMKETESHTLRGIHQHRVEIRLQMKEGQHLTKQQLKQVVLNDMWTIPAKGVDLILSEPEGGLVHIDIAFYAVATNADRLLEKLRAIDHVEQASLIQTRAASS